MVKTVVLLEYFSKAIALTYPWYNQCSTFGVEPATLSDANPASDASTCAINDHSELTRRLELDWLSLASGAANYGRCLRLIWVKFLARCLALLGA